MLLALLDEWRLMGGAMCVIGAADRLAGKPVQSGLGLADEGMMATYVVVALAAPLLKRVVCRATPTNG